MVTPQQTTLKDHVYHQVIEMICNGQIKPGEIITERQMITHFAISKSPVREALIQLCHDNVLHSIPRCGYQVVHISVKNILDLTELRLHIELGSLSKLITVLTPEVVDRLDEINRLRDIPPQEKDVWSAWQNNEQFHLGLVAGTGNTYALEALERALSVCTRAYAQLFFSRRESVIYPRERTHAHERIVTALTSRDLPLAQKLLREDILCMQTELLSSSAPIAQ